jgi:hypothetical protein
MPMARVPSTNVSSDSQTIQPAHALIRKKYTRPMMKLATSAPITSQHILISAKARVKMFAFTACTTEFSVGSGTQIKFPMFMLLYDAVMLVLQIDPKHSTLVLS